MNKILATCYLHGFILLQSFVLRRKLVAHNDAYPFVVEWVMKPYKGKLTNWKFTDTYGPVKVSAPYLLCLFVDHPDFQGKSGYTSWVVRFDKETGQVETRNSLYQLSGEGYVPVNFPDLTETVKVLYP